PEQETTERVVPAASPSPRTSPPPSSSASPASSSPPASPPPSAPSAAAKAAGAKASSSSKSKSPSSQSPSSSDGDKPIETAGPVRQRAHRTEVFIGSALYLDLAPARMPVFFTVGGSAATRLRTGENGLTTRWFDVSLGAGAPLL